MKFLKIFLLAILCVSLCLSFFACGDTAEVSSREKLVTSNDNPIRDMEVNRDMIKTEIVKTKYETSDLVISNFNVLAYGADDTGYYDSTDSILQAIYACNASGGGVVWFPAGKYRITKRIPVFPLVYLRGDWQDPDKGNEYGSVIILDIPSEDNDETGTFILQGSCGIEGLTFYYKNQNIDEPVPYPFTVFCTSMLTTVRNCTIINGYRGVGAKKTDAHEQMMIKNLKGTVIRKGVAIYNSSDVGTIDGLTLSPKYWANAGEGFERADEEKIVAFQKKNSAGLEITDAEQQQMYNIQIEGYKYGVFFPSMKRRYCGSGSFYALNVENCENGVYAENGVINGLTTVDSRWGFVISNSKISGSDYSIYNGSTPINGSTAVFKLSGVKLDGHTLGKIDENSKDVNLSAFSPKDTDPILKPSGENLEIIEKNQTEDDIQAALDRVYSLGGGIVFVKGGIYEISKGLTVPDGVELRGAALLGHRVTTKGTVFAAKQKAIKSGEVNGAKAVVTLGENSGMRGIFIIHPENINAVWNQKPYKIYPYAVRAEKDGAYCVACCISGASHGIDFSKCKNHVISDITICCVEKSMVVGGDGIVMNCLQNGTVLTRTNFKDLGGSGEIFNTLRNSSDVINVVGDNEIILNCFTYGARKLVVSKNAENLLCINVGADNIGDPGTGIMEDISGGSAVIINSLRYNGSSYKNSGAKLKIYNRMAIFHQNEKDVDE